MRQEKKVAELTGGQTTLASGALFNQKGDFVTDLHRGECKFTRDCTQITLKREWMDKITKEALKTAKKPCLCLSMSSQKTPDYVLITWDDFVEAYYEPSK